MRYFSPSYATFYIDNHNMIFVSFLIDSPDPIELIVVDSNPDDIENDLEAININDFFRLSGQIISVSGKKDRMPKMDASSFNVTKNLGIITGTLLCLKPHNQYYHN